MPRRLLWILTSVFVGAAHAQDSAAPPPGELAAATAAQLDSYLPRLFDNEPDPAKRLAAIAAATMGQRYAESPLGEGTYDSRDPKPLYALDRSDSRSFVEQALAMAVSRDFGAFFLILQRLRYIDGQVSTTQRHHNLLADWAPRNAWLLSNVTRECSEGMAWVPSHQVVRRARFLQDRFNITTDIPDEKFIGDFIPRCFAVQALDDLRGGDVVLLITGDDRQQFCTELGILLKDPTAANPFDIVHSQPPAVVKEPFRGMLYHRKEILGFQVLRLRPDAVDLARAEVTRLAGQIAVPSTD